MVREDLTGRKFGRLTVESLHDIKDYGRKKVPRWLCRCDCGGSTVAFGDNLKRGNTSSCGCLARERLIERNFRHGKCSHPIYISWERMKGRCSQKNYEHYDCYGGRGIDVCDEWKNDFNSFYDWSIKNGWAPGLSIDRIDVDKNYCPENCRWADAEMQANNKRNTHYVTAFGKTLSITQWERESEIGRSTIWWRLSHGWSAEDALTKPAGKQGRRHEP